MKSENGLSKKNRELFHKCVIRFSVRGLKGLGGGGVGSLRGLGRVAIKYPSKGTETQRGVPFVWRLAREYLAVGIGVLQGRGCGRPLRCRVVSGASCTLQREKAGLLIRKHDHFTRTREIDLHVEHWLAQTAHEGSRRRGAFWVFSSLVSASRCGRREVPPEPEEVPHYEKVPPPTTTVGPQAHAYCRVLLRKGGWNYR